LHALKMNFDKLEAKVEKEHSRNDDIKHLEFEIADMRSLEKQVGELSAQISAQENADNQCEVRLHGMPYKEGDSLKTLFKYSPFHLESHRHQNFWRFLGSKHATRRALLLIQ